MPATITPLCPKTAPAPPTTDDDVCAAMSVWEDMLTAKATGEPEFTAMLTLWARIGTSAMGAKAFTIGRFANAVWNGLDEDTRDMLAPFDWEFVPALLRSIEFTTPGVVLAPVAMAVEAMTTKAIERAAQYALSVKHQNEGRTV